MEVIRDFQTFLEKTNEKLEPKIKEVDDALPDSKTDDTELVGNMEHMLETLVKKAEETVDFLAAFKTRLFEKNLIKSSVPHLNVLDEDGRRKRDSGLALSISSSSPQTSSNRLSGLSGIGDHNSDDRNKEVKFDLQSHTSLSDLGGIVAEEEAEGAEQVVNPSQLDCLYIHLVPTNPNTDLTALKEKLYNISRETMKTNNVQFHIVPSDSFIGITSRQTSTSSDGLPQRQSSLSSERLNSEFRHRLPSSNESLNTLLNNLSKVPAEHSDLSEENNSRQASSSDSDISMVQSRLQILNGDYTTLAQYRLRLIHAETQTEHVSEEQNTASCPVQPDVAL